ncbi:MAG: hypothetical protein R3C61_10450 [Bacteroidia bacterium]
MKNKSYIFLICMIALLTPLFSQNTSFSIFNYNELPGWQKTTGNGWIQYSLIKGSSWVVVGIYESAAGTGSARGDFQADWDNLVVPHYTIQRQSAPREDFVNGWKRWQNSASVSKDGQNFTLNIYTYSGSDQRATIMTMVNDPLINPEAQRFLKGLTPVTISPTGNGSSLPPAHTIPVGKAGAFPVPARKPVTFSMNAEGWLVEATDEYISYSRPDIQVIQYFFRAPEDPNSNTPDEDLFWRKFLNQYFFTSEYQKYPNDIYAFFDRIEFASAYATSLTDNKRYFIAWLVSNKSLCSFLVICNSEAVYNQYFPHPDKIDEMERFNHFPLEKEDLTGVWIESGFQGMDVYNIQTGAYGGMAFATSAEEWTFTGNQFQFFASGASGMVGAMQTFTVRYSGSFTFSDYSLTTHAVATGTQPAKTSEYYAAVKAIKGGKLLWLQNKQYTAQISNLVRKP